MVEHQSVIPFFIVKWTQVIFYMSLLILRIVSSKPRRFLRRKFRSKKKPKFEEENVIGKIVVITGCNSGIGKEVCLEFAKRRATVIMACRNIRSAQNAIVDIRNKTFLGTLVPMTLDLASLESIRNFVEKVEEKYDKINILVLNAGVLIPEEKNETTSDGFEPNFGVNHLGHFLLTSLLIKCLHRAVTARIVIVSSLAMKYGKINFEDPMKPTGKSPYTCCPVLHYANSKLANGLFNFELAKRLEGTDIRTYCLCPGISATNIDRDVSPASGPLHKYIKRLLFISANQASQTVLYCALATDCSRQSGELYRRCRLWDSTYVFPDDLFLPGKMPFFNDQDAQKLWQLSEKLTKCKFEVPDDTR